MCKQENALCKMRTGFKRFQTKEILEAVGRMVEYKKNESSAELLKCIIIRYNLKWGIVQGAAG